MIFSIKRFKKQTNFFLNIILVLSIIYSFVAVFSYSNIILTESDFYILYPFETILLLDTLEIKTASLPFEQVNKLYKNIMKDYVDEKSKFKRLIKVKENKFFNALQVKYSYAITCHKSQGGQWENVFIEKPYLPNGLNKEYLRWLYTAITRATKNLYLLGFTSEDFNMQN